MQIASKKHTYNWSLTENLICFFKCWETLQSDLWGLLFINPHYSSQFKCDNLIKDFANLLGTWFKFSMIIWTYGQCELGAAMPSSHNISCDVKFTYAKQYVIKGWCGFHLYTIWSHKRLWELHLYTIWTHKRLCEFYFYTIWSHKRLMWVSFTQKMTSYFEYVEHFESNWVHLHRKWVHFHS